MAEQNKDSRTEPATEKRRRESREKGQLPRSRDLTAAAVTLASVAAILLGRESLVADMTHILHGGLERSRSALLADDAMVSALMSAGQQALIVLTPLLGATLVAAFASSLLLGGWNFSTNAFSFKGERLDPIAGLGRIFSANGLVELGKALLKVLVIGGISVMIMRHALPQLLEGSNSTMQHGIGIALDAVVVAAISLACALLLIGLVDAPWQLFRSSRDLRMTRDEVRQELRESDGSPETRGRVRKLQQQMAQRRMMIEVPKADVVVTNPTHFAVALRYEDRKMRAPIVVAKGADHMALQIRAIAKRHRVPLLESPALARALYRHADIGAEVPTRLWVAVAQVLAYVYQVKQAAAGNGPMPEPPVAEIDPSLSDPPTG